MADSNRHFITGNTYPVTAKIAVETAVSRGADLGGADLHGAYLHGADLHGADLHGADLGGADLRGADLHGADLRGADLHVAYLGGADLRGADLHGADLHVAYLGGADLRGADLHGADLHGADLRGADLHGADLRGADLGGAYLHGADLRGADLGGAKLSWMSHWLLAHLLFREASDSIPRRKLAGLVDLSTDWCWDQFLALDDPERDWAIDTLGTYVIDGDDAPQILRDRQAAAAGAELAGEESPGLRCGTAAGDHRTMG